MTKQKTCRIKNATWDRNRVNSKSDIENCILAVALDKTVVNIWDGLLECGITELSALRKYRDAISSTDSSILKEDTILVLQELAKKLNIKLIIEE